MSVSHLPDDFRRIPMLAMAMSDVQRQLETLLSVYGTRAERFCGTEGGEEKWPDRPSCRKGVQTLAHASEATARLAQPQARPFGEELGLMLGQRKMVLFRRSPKFVGMTQQLRPILQQRAAEQRQAQCHDQRPGMRLHPCRRVALVAAMKRLLEISLDQLAQ